MCMQGVSSGVLVHKYLFDAEWTKTVRIFPRCFLIVAV